MASKLINVTSLTGLGLRDWLVQRVSSVVLAAYFLFLMGYFFCHPQLQFDTWHDLYAGMWMRVFTILALLSLFLHAWVGMWTIATDYLKVTWVRMVFQIAVIIALIAYFIWGVLILF